MKILLLAPHPFYQERGTPIAVKLMLQALSERGEEVDVLTYHEGKSITYENVNIRRIPNLFFIRNIRPGFSWQKIICDIFMFFMLISMVVRKRYDIVHAVEESVFMAIIIKKLFGIPYIYDMDSSIAQQMVEKLPYLKPFSRFFNLMEGFAVNQAAAVVAVCEALANVAEGYDTNKNITILHDIPLIRLDVNKLNSNLGKELGICGLKLMYIGNLESYQGIDLLLESFQRALKERNSVDLIIIGGADSDIRKYQLKSEKLGIAKKVYFLGPKPVEQLGEYLEQADILVSPRIKGKNTPMKIYSYLYSGKPILVTDIYSHTQILNDQIAMIADSTPENFSKALIALLENEEIRMNLGIEGKKLVERNYTYSVFKDKLGKLYSNMEMELTGIK